MATETRAIASQVMNLFQRLAEANTSGNARKNSHEELSGVHEDPTIVLVLQS